MAVASTRPGDTLVVRDGTHTDWHVALRTSGTATAPVTLKAQTPGGVKFTNNLVTGKTGILIDDEGSREGKWQSNLVWPRGDAKVGSSGPGIVRTDPNLLHDGSRFVPSPSSPARDAGSLLPSVSADYSGRERNGLPDIGSDEISDNGITRGPLRPSDVGPSWNRK